MPDRILVAVAWPYANGSLHLGHLAGCYLPADIFARYHRLKGNDVLMVSGSDQHGTPVTIRAEQEGTSPQEVVSKYHAEFLDSWERMGISFDLFTTTGTENHRKVVHDLFPQPVRQGQYLQGHHAAAPLRQLHPVPPGPVRGRRVPPLRQSQRAGRSVRPLRQDVEPGGAGNAPLRHLRLRPRV